MTTDQPTSESNLRKLTQEEFIDIITLKDQEKYAEFYGQYYPYLQTIILKDVAVGPIQLTDGLVVRLPIIIVNGLFEHFSIKGGEFKEIFRIEGGEFKEGFWIEGGEFKEYFRIYGGEFKEYFRIYGGEFQKYFGISGGEFQQDFRIEGGEFQKNFWISGGEFQKTFSISGGEFKEGFWIYGGEFQEYFGIYGGGFQKDFRISGGEFKQYFGISGGEFKQYFRISGGEFQKNFRILGGQFQQDFWILGGEFQQDFWIYGGEFKSISCIKGFINQFTISHLPPKVEFTIHSTFVINQLVFTTTIPKDSLIRLGSQLYALSFTNVQNFGLLILNGFSFKKEWSHPKDVTSSEQPSSAPPQLTIENSDLGKMTFINSDLSGFDLVFKSSKITEVFVTGTKMPRRITTINKADKPDFTQHQLGYSQIKKIYEARGDRIEANRYFAKEMEAYRNTLSNKGDFWEKLNLNLNRFSTNYGQSWERGLWTTFLVSGLFYLLYCLFLGFLPCFPTWPAVKQFGTILSYFLEFINPIHKADYIAQQLLGEDSHISGWARSVEGISRIFIAYFVYQLIQAFRKHGKSSG